MDRSLEEAVAAIRAEHRPRSFAMDVRKALDLKLQQYLKYQLGWRKSLPKKERDAIAAMADGLIEIGEAIEKAKAVYAKKRLKAMSNGAAHDDLRPSVEGERDELFIVHAPIIETMLKARGGFDDIEDKCTKEMEAAVKKLPIYEVMKDVPGLKSGLSLAIIIAETAAEQDGNRLGTLSDYPTHSKVWKRLGLAVMGRGDGVDDIRQGGLSKNAPKADWIAHGYSRQRRSRIWTIGDVSLVKLAGPYRDIYLARKEYERKKAEEAGLADIERLVKKGRKVSEFRSDGHVHRRARRYMEKRLVRDIWKAWVKLHGKVERQAATEMAEKPKGRLLAANERERATSSVAAKPIDVVPAPSSPTAERWMDHG
jgi:hypothetical protein